MKQYIEMVACAMLLALGASGAVPLTQDGQPLAEIVLPPGSHPAVEFAAQEFQHWVNEISGARLPIVPQPGEAQARLIVAINPDGFAGDIAQLKDNDGYAVRTSGSTVTLLASRPKGILNGVFGLLYRNTDIIWARPNLEFGTIFSHNPDLSLTDSDYIDVPVYKLRGWQMGSGRDMANEEWQVRNGCNWSAGSMTFQEERIKFDPILEYGGGHNLVGRYIPEKKYFEKHPEYYPLKDGKRLRPSETRGGTQICFTLPELQEVFIREVDEHVRGNPSYDTYRIMIEDNWNLCECETCLAPIALPHGRTITTEDEAFRSTQFFLWLNPIARHIGERHGKDVLVFAYFFTEPPPKCSIEPNVRISFCPIGKNSKRAVTHPENATTLARFNGWLQVTTNIIWREYYGLCASFPRPIDAVALADWQYINGFGVDRTYSEMRPDYGRHAESWDANAMYFWVMANGAWNPRRTAEELREEFLTRVFGPAAADAGEFFRLIEEQWLKLPGRSGWSDKAYPNWKRHVFDTGITEACLAALQRAEAKKVHPNAVRMLAGIRCVMERNLRLQEQETVTAFKAAEKPEFDPAFNSGAWLQSVPNTNFLLNVTEEAYDHPTSVRVLYDQENIYFGIQCGHPEPARMTYEKFNNGKNTWPEGENFEIFLEGGWREKRHFTQMVVSPVNNRFNGVRHADMTTMATVTDNGWSGMITVTWKSLGLSPEDAGTLKASFFRQFMIPIRKGTAPPRNAHLPGCLRHSMQMTSRLAFQ